MTGQDLIVTMRCIEAAPPAEGGRLYFLKAAYPRFEWGGARKPGKKEQRALERINRHYRKLAADYAVGVGRRWRAPQHKRLLREGEAFAPRHFEQTAQATLTDRHLFVLTKRKEHGPQGARSDSFADCFDLADGRLLTFDEVFTRPQAARLAADIEVAEQLARRAGLPGSTLRKNAVRRAVRHPAKQGFWRGKSGAFVLLYPAGLLAEQAVGALRFTLPESWAQKYYAG